VDIGIGFEGMDIGTGFVVAGMADVESAVACVFTGIRRGGLRCSVFGPKGRLGRPSIATNSLQWSPVVISFRIVCRGE